MHPHGGDISESAGKEKEKERQRMHVKWEKHTEWMIPVLVILLVLVMATLAVCATMAYAGRSEKPDNTLTCRDGKLEWDGHTGIDPQTGEYELLLFEGMSEGRDGKKIIAPGDGDRRIVRLSNRSGGEVQYVAVLYLESGAGVPVKGEFTSHEKAEEGTVSILPEGMEDAQVLDVAGGSVGKGKIEDFDIAWSWEYEGDEMKDAADTALGTDGGSAKLGVYITVSGRREDLDEYSDKWSDMNDSAESAGEGEQPGGADDAGSDGILRPQAPQTGDRGALVWILVTAAAAGMLWIMTRKRQSL